MNKIPELDHPFFSVDNLTPVDFFQEDYRYYAFDDPKRPWEEGEKALKEILRTWEGKNQRLAALFRRREKEGIGRLMVESVALFCQYLFWSNEQPVRLNRLTEAVEGLEVKAINVSERLAFIMQRPNLHHSFIQLGELFVEQEKAYYKNKTIKERAAKE